MQIIIALDNMKFDKALESMILLGSYVDGFKINHTLLENASMFENYAENESSTDLFILKFSQ